jgi:hypothetical protein
MMLYDKPISKAMELIPELKKIEQNRKSRRRRFCAESLTINGRRITPMPHSGDSYIAPVDGGDIVGKGKLDFWRKVLGHYRERESQNKTFHGGPKKLAGYLAAIETVQNRVNQLEAAKAKAES